MVFTCVFSWWNWNGSSCFLSRPIDHRNHSISIHTTIGDKLRLDLACLCFSFLSLTSIISARIIVRTYSCLLPHWNHCFGKAPIHPCSSCKAKIIFHTIIMISQNKNLIQTIIINVTINTLKNQINLLKSNWWWLFFNRDPNFKLDTFLHPTLLYRFPCEKHTINLTSAVSIEFSNQDFGCWGRFIQSHAQPPT